MIIGFLNQKGGVGKSTLAINVAGEFARDGARVLLIDADPQGSALDWSATREGEGPFSVIALPRATVHKEITEIARGYDHVIIDGPPRVTELARSIIMASGTIVIPTQPSALDIWAAEEVVSLVREASVYKEDLKAVFAVNRRIGNTAIGRSAAEALKHHGIPLLKNYIAQRVIFAESASQGKLVREVAPKSLAAKEVAALANEIREYK